MRPVHYKNLGVSTRYDIRAREVEDALIKRDIKTAIQYELESILLKENVIEFLKNENDTKTTKTLTGLVRVDEGILKLKEGTLDKAINFYNYCKKNNPEIIFKYMFTGGKNVL